MPDDLINLSRSASVPTDVSSGVGAQACANNRGWFARGQRPRLRVFLGEFDGYVLRHCHDVAVCGEFGIHGGGVLFVAA